MPIKNEEEYQDKLEKYKHLVNRLQGKAGGELAEKRDNLQAQLSGYRSRVYTLGVEVVPRPCPFCNKKKLDLILDRRRGYYVVCMTCHASGPYGMQQEPAVRVWNERNK